jgi:hypothetical protein
MTAVSPDFRNWFERLRNEQISENDVSAIYSLLCKAHPLTDKAPFFPDKSYPQRTVGREKLWPLARLAPITAGLYGKLYSPQPGPPVVFKEVTFVKPTRNLAQKTSVPIVYIVRHPCATVLSDVNGQLQGKMPSGRQQRLREVVLELMPELAERFADVLTSTDIVSRTALLWRCEVENCVTSLREASRGMVLTYEQFAEDAYTQTKRVLAHFGLSYSPETERFIDAQYGIEESARGSPRRTGWGDPYYSVNRNPRLQKDAWKTRISSEDRRKVESIVADSEAVAFLSRLGGWS